MKQHRRKLHQFRERFLLMSIVILILSVLVSAILFTLGNLQIIPWSTPLSTVFGGAIIPVLLGIVGLAQWLHSLHRSAPSNSPATRPLETVSLSFPPPPDQQQAFVASSETFSTPMFKSEPIWNVPSIPTPLIGREQDVATICTFLKSGEVRELTILGAGGIGKTRLSIEVAVQLRDAFADGICFIQLASITDPQLVAFNIAQELSIQEFHQVKTFLKEKHFLLILDNFEQVVQAAFQVEELLLACPFLKILVTSRMALHIQGEQEFPVPPLALPNLQLLPESNALLQYAAIVLFVQRARAVVPTFQLTQANARAIAEICVHVDGLPLAIELAAARIKLFSPQALLTRLSHRLTILIGGARTLPARQQSLRNTLQWSYDLLEAEEQQLFRCVSVFVGGCTLKAIEAVTTKREKRPLSIIDLVTSLLNKSLLQMVEQDGEEPRFSMLETIREYGLECLTNCGEAKEAHDAHALYYLFRAEEAESYLKGKEQFSWLEQLEQEQENLRAALRWFIECEEAQYAVRLCGALWWYWETRGYWSEGRRWFEIALRLPQAQYPTEARAKALCGAGNLAYHQGDFTTARLMAEESSEIARELGKKHILIHSLSTLGNLLGTQGNLPAERDLLEEGVTLCREISDLWQLSRLLISLSAVVARQGDLRRGAALQQESLALARELGDKSLISDGLNNLGHIYRYQGDLERAASLAQEALTIARELGDKFLITDALISLGYLNIFLGDLIHAETLSQEALTTARKLEDKHLMSNGLRNLGQLALFQGNLAAAMTFQQEALILVERLGARATIAARLSDLAYVKALQKDTVQAIALQQNALTLVKELGDAPLMASMLQRLGLITWIRHDTTKAKAYYQEGLALAQKIESRRIARLCLIGLATVFAAEGHLMRAALLLGAVKTIEDVKLEMDPFERRTYDSTIEDVRAQLGEEVLTTTRANGQTISLEQLLTAPEQVPRKITDCDLQ